MPDTNKGRSYSLLFVALLALLMLGTLLYAQYFFSKRADNALCETLITLVERSDASLDDHPYFSRHPQELDDAHKQNEQTLRDLRNACPE